MALEDVLLMFGLQLLDRSILMTGFFCRRDAISLLRVYGSHYRRYTVGELKWILNLNLKILINRLRTKDIYFLYVDDIPKEWIYRDLIP